METLYCAKVKDIDSSAEYILMPHRLSAICTVLLSSSGLFSYYSQCRQNCPCLFFPGPVNELVKPQCQHTPHISLPPPSPHDFTLSLCPTTHTLTAGVIDGAATNFGFLDAEA